MINFRYHIISLTAVFLALGVGLALGANFIDTATVDTLENQLTAIEDQRDGLDRRNDRLQDQIEVSDELAEQAESQLLDGRLEDVPVVLVAVRGVDEDHVDAVRQAVVDADAAFAGTLWITERLVLNDQAAITDLGDILNLPATDPSRLASTLVSRLAELLTEAAGPGVEPPADVPPTTTTATGGATPQQATTTSTEPVPPEPEPEREPEREPEPALITELRDGGFLEFDPPPVDPEEFTVLPATGARYLVVAGPGAAVPDAAVVVPLLRAMAEDGQAPVVAAQGVADEAAEGEDEPSRTGFVGLLREDAEVGTRLSTVDDLETFAGRVAAVLALAHLGQGQVGHYGIGDGAESVVPPPLED